MKNVQKIDLGLTGYDELFMNDAERKENKLPRIYDVPISEIDDFPDHPFKVKIDEDIASAAEEIIKETEKANEQVGANAELTASDCTPVTWEDSIENKVIAIKGNTLRPEFRHASHQLMLCTGGFGSQANARGRTCYCISLYDGRQTSYYRSDVLGVIEPEKLPEWAQKGLEKAKEIHEQEKKPPKERGEAR